MSRARRAGKKRRRRSGSYVEEIIARPTPPAALAAGRSRAYSRTASQAPEGEGIPPLAPIWPQDTLDTVGIWGIHAFSRPIPPTNPLSPQVSAH